MDKENQKAPKLRVAFGPVRQYISGPDIEYTICPIIVVTLISREIMIQKVRRKVERVVSFCRDLVF